MPPGVSRPLDNLQATSILSLPRRNTGGSAFQAPSAGAAAKALTSGIEKKLLRFKDEVFRNDRASTHRIFDVVTSCKTNSRPLSHLPSIIYVTYPDP